MVDGVEQDTLTVTARTLKVFHAVNAFSILPDSAAFLNSREAVEIADAGATAEVIELPS